MAVHFDCILDDEDAENIFYALRDAALNSDIKIMNTMADTTLSETYKNSTIEWYNKNKAYMLDLIIKMKNTRVPE